MKLVYENMGHIIKFTEGYTNEIVIENKKMFFDIVNNAYMQAEGAGGKFTLSIADKPVEFSRHVDVIIQFVPFQINRKPLLTKLNTLLEQRAMLPENYGKTNTLLSETEAYLHYLAEDFSFEINCQKTSVNSIIRAFSPEIDEKAKDGIERVFTYMELVRELDRDRLFVMVNMRTYFSDEEMERFIESACLHDFKVLLIESMPLAKLNNTKRYIIDTDLCEF